MPFAGYISSLPAERLAQAFPRRLAVLGSTGSIGVNALKVVEEHPDEFDLVALAGARNIALLAEQALRWRPRYLAVLEEEGAEALKRLLPARYAPEILVGPRGYETLATLPEIEMLLAAQVGAAGLLPTLAAAKTGKIIALANKEALVLAGELIREACAESGAVILPVDSEHNALFQALAGHEMNDVRKLVLTASGGPFRGRDLAFLGKVKAKDALKHPNWSMGAKISIDSATLMNKGLEVIEAHHLYGLDVSRIEVVVHPQSIIHSLVEYHDGSLLAHLGRPDMRIPIGYCLGYPRRLSLSMEPLDLVELGRLTFERPDLSLFPCLRLAMDSIASDRPGPGCPVVLNAANEILVAQFLNDAIEFLDIPALAAKALNAYAEDVSALPLAKSASLDVETILELDRVTRERVSGWIEPRPR
jgi:1-deoxy-D-xylulose-5-phosphate reductoisomerase